MPGSVRVGRPNRIRHIPLSWDVAKARSNHEPKFRPVGDRILRGRERSVGRVVEELFAAMPPIEPIITGEMDVAEYHAEAVQAAEPYRVQIAEILQPTFNEGALIGQDRIRADVNDQLRRLGSPLRLTDTDGNVTKATADPQTVGGVRVGRSPKAEWATVGVEAFDSVDAASVQYAQFRSGTLVTAMVEEQRQVIQSVIGESFTTQQTFSTGRTVTGLTAQQTSQALVTVLQDVNPTTPVGQNLARFRGVNMNGLTRPWERAVYNRAERMADMLAKQGITGVKAQKKIQKSAQAHANKLRRSRSRMISRTEIKRAQVQGQLASMRQAVSDGLADPRTAGKKWVTGPTDVCPVCSDLGFGKAIPLDQSFEGVGDGPPAHPSCRCDLDFAHTISEAPKAVGAGDPNFPAGTPENPITWQFPSGFQTQPSATRTFTPPGFVPPVSPAAAITTPPTVAEDALEEAARVFQEAGDDGTEALFDHLGFSAQPRVVEADDLARLVDESPAGEMRRVVSSTDRKNPTTGRWETVEPDEVAETFRRGKNFVGDGAHGRGTYTVEGTAEAFEEYALRTIPHTVQRGEVLEMTLAKEARIYEFVGDPYKAGTKLLDEYAHLGFTEPHQLLASLGYDAVRYTRTEEAFMVILNRSKVIVGKARGAKVGNLKPFKHLTHLVPPARPTKRPAAGVSTMETPQPAAFGDDLDGMMAAVADDAAAQGTTGPAQLSWESDAVTEVYGASRIHGPQYYYDNRLKAGRRVQGFDKKPMRATHEELDDLVDRGGINLFRGDEEAEFMADLLDGDYYPGQGIFGNGTYFDGTVTVETSAAKIGEHLSTAAEYAGYTGSKGRVVRGVLKPNARTVSHKDIKILQGEVRSLTEEVKTMAQAFVDELTTGGIDDATRQLAVEDVAALRRSVKRRRSKRTAIVSEDAEKALDDLLEELLQVESLADAQAVHAKAGYLTDMASDEGTTAVLFGIDVIEANYGFRVILNRDAVVFADSVITPDQARAASKLWIEAINETGDLSPTSAFQSVAGRSADELGIGNPFE